MQPLKLKLEVAMFLSEKQVNYLASEFMPRLKEESIVAMIDVACNGMSIIASSQKYGITHQSLSKNLQKLKELQKKIDFASNLFSSSYLLEKQAEALLMNDKSFADAKDFLVQLCKNLDGRVETNNSLTEVKLYQGKTVTCIFLNPENHDQEWSFDHNDVE